MSKFTLSAATAEDIAKSAQCSSESADHLLPPAIPVFWRVRPESKMEATTRKLWGVQQQLDILNLDTTVRFVKVTSINADGEQVTIALGRWHHYTAGYEPCHNVELAGAKDIHDPATWPAGFKRLDYLAWWNEALAARRQWMGISEYWVLTTVCTREPFRKRGAASMILKWGLSQARLAHAPAFLEAVADAIHLYQQHGFRTVGCQIARVNGESIVISRMRADP